MRQFTYHRSTSAQDAVDAFAAAANARYIAGGTNLLDLMKLEIEAPEHVIDINHIGLDQISEISSGGLRVGALVRNADLATDQRIRRNYPVLARALVAAASGQLRNMATTGGNLMQRTRCPYFYDTNQSCAKRDPNTPCSAIVGFNRNHAVQGVGNCLCAFPSDMSVALRVLDAVVEIMQPGGKTRQVPIEDFHLLPDTLPIREFALNPGELITGVVLPPPLGGRHYYRKVRNRASFAFALVSVAAVIQPDGSGRIALGGVATKPWRSAAGDAAIPQGAKAVTTALMQGAQPTDQNRYKIALTERTIAAVLAQAKGTVS